MTLYEYKVIPAPVRGEKVRGAKTSADRFAVALSGVMNSLARDGWEYLRAETLPCEERVGFTGKTTVFQNMLIFRRLIAAAGQTMTDPSAASPLLTAQVPTMAEPLVPRLGAAEVPAGLAPAVGPVRPEFAAE